MCSSLGKFFSCTRPSEEDWESSKERRQDQHQHPHPHQYQRQQFVALNGGEAIVQRRRRNRRPKQPPPTLPVAVATTLPVATTRTTSRDRNSCNSYEAMERHDQQIFEDNTLRDYDEQL
ncbi:hypothetical protein ACLKA7_007293 [Drosophila subpalustris]